ncbi:RDD family protein [bacterium]|nr:RDD family protein [bacterium]
MHYAGLQSRFWALVIDFAALSAVFFPVTRIVKGVWLMQPTDHLWGYGWIVTDPLCLIFLLAIFVYFVIGEGMFGATIGKRVLGLRVTREDGMAISLGQAVVRNLLRLVDGLPALNIVGVVLIMRSPERARFGDRVAGTRVVRR